MLQGQTPTVQDLAQLIRWLSSTAQAVFKVLLYYRNLQQDQIAALHWHNSYESQIVLFLSSKEELESWISYVKTWNGQTFLNPTPNIPIQTAASLQGWGTCMQSIHTGRKWLTAEQMLRINHLEMLAVDNVTVMSYISHKQGDHILMYCQISDKKYGHGVQIKQYQI